MEHARRHRRADRARLGGRRRHRGPAALDARHEVASAIDDAGPGRASARRAEATVRIFGIAVTRPGRDHRVRAAAPVRDPATTGSFTGDGLITLEAGADGTTTIVRWEERLVAAGAPAPRARSSGPILALDLPGRPRPPQAAGRDRARPRRPRATGRRCRSTSSTRPTSCSGPTSRRDRPSSGGTACRCRASPASSSSCCYLLREEGATHVGCATDRVIESFRNDLYPGYKTSAGMPPELLAQFPIAEAAIEALGIVLWPMVEFEADDAIARRRRPVRRGPARRADRRLHARQGHGPARPRRAGRPVGPAPRPRSTTTPACATKWGVAPRVDPRLARRSSATRRTASRGSPAGARSRPPAVLTPLRPLRGRSRPRPRPGKSRASAARGR